MFRQNNLVRIRSKEVLRNYGDLVKKLKGSRTKDVLMGLLPSYDVRAVALSRILRIYGRV